MWRSGPLFQGLTGGRALMGSTRNRGLVLLYRVGWGDYARFWKYISPVLMRVLVDLGGRGGLTGFGRRAGGGGVVADRPMHRITFRAIVGISFLALLPLSWRVGDALFFTRPFDRSLFDPVLVICSGRVGVLRWHELGETHNVSPGDGCTFQVAPAQQKLVERAVRQLQSPAPGKSAWILHATQLGANRQRIDLELGGDGVAGMIYEVQNDKITPLKSGLAGPLGGLFPLIINVALWLFIWLPVWAVLKRREGSA